MLNSLRSCSIPAAAGERGGGAVAPSPRRFAALPSLTRGLRSALRSPAARSPLPPRPVVFGSLHGCAVGGACCALRGFAPWRAPPRLGSSAVVRGSALGLAACAPSPRAVRLPASRALPPPLVAALLWGRSPAARAVVAPAGGRRLPRSLPAGGPRPVPRSRCLPFRAAAPPRPLGLVRWWSWDDSQRGFAAPGIDCQPGSGAAVLVRLPTPAHIARPMFSLPEKG